MVEGDKEKTAFTFGKMGFYGCNCMAFGWISALVTFQLLMEQCTGKMNFKTMFNFP